MKEKSIKNFTMCTSGIDYERWAKQTALIVFFKKYRGIKKILNLQNTVTFDEDGNKLIEIHKRYMSSDQLSHALSEGASAEKVLMAYMEVEACLLDNNYLNMYNELTEIYINTYRSGLIEMRNSLHDANKKKNTRNIRQNNINRNSCL